MTGLTRSLRKSCFFEHAASPAPKLLGVLLAATFMLGANLTAAAFDKPPFPRIGGIQIGSKDGKKDYEDPAYQTQMARQSLTILNMWPGFMPGRQPMHDVVQSIKNQNQNALVFVYINEGELGEPGVTGTAMDAIRAKLNSMNWWLYQNGGSGTRVVSVFQPPNYYQINHTGFTPTDSNGDNAMSWLTKYYVQQYINVTPMPGFDGFFLDNMFWKPRVSGDWNRDGTTEAGSTNNTIDPNPTASRWFREGYRDYVALARSQMPGSFQIANIADWGFPQAVLTEYQNVVDGGVLEGYIGHSWSFETVQGWQFMMNAYRKTMAALHEPKLAIFNQGGDRTDYRSMRYGLASCLLDDAYYSFNDNADGYYGVEWFDEYDARLGAAISPPSTQAWLQGVYRRDFENGIALVNPKGNGDKTITLETDFVKLLGTQDPVVNDGSVVRTLTLRDRDGIILLRAKKTFGRTDVATMRSGGMTADMKRGSKFTLSEAGTLLNFSAHLDGNGGASGSQSVRVVLYRDASGASGAKVAESSPVVITASAAAGSWITFNAPQVALTPGAYWLVLHTGGTAGIARNAGDGAANWYGNADTYADGASDPFGTGSTGTGTLSIYASYAPGAPRQFGRTDMGPFHHPA